MLPPYIISLYVFVAVFLHLGAIFYLIRLVARRRRKCSCKKICHLPLRRLPFPEKVFPKSDLLFIPPPAPRNEFEYFRDVLQTDARNQL